MSKLTGSVLGSNLSKKLYFSVFFLRNLLVGSVKSRKSQMWYHFEKKKKIALMFDSYECLSKLNIHTL